MKLRYVVALLWLVVACGVVMTPYLCERYYWGQLEAQAEQADVVEGDQP